MKVTNFTREVLGCRKEARELEPLGYVKHETNWEIIRGGRYREVIIDARISHCGKYVWTKIGSRDET